MPLYLIPYGRGTGKLWLLGILIFVILFACVCGLESLVKSINLEEVTNPVAVIFGIVIHAIYAGLVWVFNFVVRWGVLAVIPIFVVVAAIVILIVSLLDRISEIRNKRRNRRNVIRL